MARMPPLVSATLTKRRQQRQVKIDGQIGRICVPSGDQASSRMRRQMPPARRQVSQLMRRPR